MFTLRSNGNRIGKRVCGLDTSEGRQSKPEELPPRRLSPPDPRSLCHPSQQWTVLYLLSRPLRKSTRLCRRFPRKLFLKAMTLPYPRGPRPLYLPRSRLTSSHSPRLSSVLQRKLVPPETRNPSRPRDPWPFPRPVCLPRTRMIIIHSSRRPEAHVTILSYPR